jgi:peptide deformylase
MAILRIARMGHPVLARPARPVADPTAPEIRTLAGDMIETMYDAPGIGLAAPQVHVPLRVVVFEVPAGRAGEAGSPESAAVPLTILVNPEIEPLGDDRDEGWEGCLSVPGLTGRVPRYRRIRYRAFDLEGRPFAREASGFHARVVQHECDHLDGVLYPMRMTDLGTLGFVDEMRRAANAAERTAGANGGDESGADESEDAARPRL